MCVFLGVRPFLWSRLSAKVRCQGNNFQKMALAGAFCVSQTHFDLTFPNKPWFLRVCSTSVLKTLQEKEKLLVTSNSPFFPQCFLPVWKPFCHFQQIWNCGLQTPSVWISVKFVIWERVKLSIGCQILRLFLVGRILQMSKQVTF